MEVEWSRLKAGELVERARAEAIVLVPIGATEQHGPHLPVQVDSRLVGEIGLRAARIVAAREPIVVLPTIWLGLSEHHMRLGGTITLDLETFYGILRCVVRSLLQHGFKRIFILNGHGGNTTALENVVAELTVKHQIPLCCGTYWDVAAQAIAKLLEKQKRVLHACEAETSMRLALAPELIAREELPQAKGAFVPGLSAIADVNPAAYRWRYLSSRSEVGVIGDASAATPEKGEKLLDAIAQELAKTLTTKALWATPI